MTLAEVMRKHGKTLHAFGVALYAFVEANPGCTYDDARRQLGMGRSTVLDYASRLEALGLISREARANDSGIPLPTLLHPTNNTVQQADGSKQRRAPKTSTNNTVRVMDTVQQVDSTVQRVDGVGVTDATTHPTNNTVQQADGSKQYRPATRRLKQPPHTPHKDNYSFTSQPTPTATVEADADAPPSRRNSKPFDPRIKHPAIQAVRAFIHCLPDEQNRDEVIGALGEKPDMPKLAECYRVWKKQGFSKVSVAPATDWYVNGIPAKYTGAPAQKGNGNGYGRRDRSETNVSRWNEIAADPRFGFTEDSGGEAEGVGEPDYGGDGRTYEARAFR